MADSDSSDDGPLRPAQQIDVPEQVSHGGAAIGGSMLEVEEKLLGPQCPVTFCLPDGSTHEFVFRMGQSVEMLKIHLENKHGLLYDKTSCWLGDEMLLDPLSLSDTKLTPNEPNLVEVRTTK